MKAFAKNCVSGVSSDEATVFSVVQAAKMLVSAVKNYHAIQTEMNRVVSQLLEYSTVVVPL